MGEWAKNNEHVEAARVHDELERFNEQVEVKVEADMRHVRRDYEDMSDTEARMEALHQVIDFAADVRWMTEYRRQELYYATRVSKENSRELYFESPGEVGELTAPVFNKLLTVYQGLTVNPLEVKD
jgi:vacuolar-type H+-ATPase subunit I/STV1